MPQGITAIILTKNEERTLTRCLESLKWCDEIIIIDDFSTDKTVEIAREFKLKIIQHPLKNNFSQQRNFALSRANNTWVLFVDADEEVSLSLQYEITNQINNQFQVFEGYYIKRVDEIWGKRLNFGETGNCYLLRLAKKDAGEWKNKIHEVWKIKNKTKKLRNTLLHYPHQNIKSFLTEINFYSDIRADEIVSSGHKVLAWQIICYPVGKFIYNYIVRLGFIDGIPGLVLAVMMSFHSYLARSKAWLKYENQNR